MVTQKQSIAAFWVIVLKTACLKNDESYPKYEKCQVLGYFESDTRTMM
mgnify:CR=1 FL=1